MTAPVTNVRVECPKCGRVYDDWFRGSINQDLDDFDADYIRQATTATCPECGHVVELDTLVVEEGVWEFRRSDPDDPSFPQPTRPLVLHPDASDADWIKRGSWDIPATDIDELREWLAMQQISPGLFTTLEVYKAHVEAMPWLKELETMGGEER